MMNKVWLVFKRDLNSQLKRKGFIVTVIALVLGTAAAVFVPSLINSDSKTEIVVDSSVASGFVSMLEADDTLEVTKAKNEKEVKTLVEEDVDLGISGEKIYVNGSPAVEMQVANIYQIYAASEQASNFGLSESQTKELLAPEPLSTVNVGDELQGLKTGIAMVAIIGLFVLLMNVVYGAAMGIVEEKGSRIVELLVVPLTPLQLLTGKLLAFGVVGVLQLAAVGATLIAMVPIADINLPPGLGYSYVVLVISFILGYLIFAGFAAGMASLVSRQEEVGSVLTPLTMAMTGVYLVAYVAVFDPEGAIASALSLVPPFSIMIMPAKAMASELPLWELGLGIAFALILVALVFWLSARIYQRSILRTGARLKLREVLKG